MPRYLVLASYNETGKQALASKPQDRVAGVRQLIEQHGGKLQSFDFAMGEHDVVAIYECADDLTAIALSLAFQKPGHLRNFTTTRLVSGEEMLQAMEKSSGMQYQAPQRS